VEQNDKIRSPMSQLPAVYHQGGVDFYLAVGRRTVRARGPAYIRIAVEIS
jgi:hypothetical protein